MHVHTCLALCPALPHQPTVRMLYCCTAAGTQYAGEMKKGVFTIMHYLMPKRGVLSLHSGCNVGDKEDVTLFFGLSGESSLTLFDQAFPGSEAGSRHGLPISWIQSSRDDSPGPMLGAQESNQSTRSTLSSACRHWQDDAVDRPPPPPDW